MILSGDNMWLLVVIIIVILVFFICFGKRLFKMPTNHITLVNGGVGSGKTTLCVDLALRQYKRNLRQYRIRKVIYKIVKSKKKLDKPLLYSNLPIKNIPYVPLTDRLLYGLDNFNEKSVVLFTEASLSASSMDFKTIDYEEFNKGIKLFRHRTKGGNMFVDTQAVSDLHFTLKRSINSYVWIERHIKIPFLLVYKVRSMLLLDETSVNVNKDPQKETRVLLCWKRVWKKFDSYNFYGLYKDTPKIRKTVVRKKDLKSYDYVKLRKLGDTNETKTKKLL